MSTTVLKNSAGDFLGVTTIFRDISEFRKLQEEIQRTERLASLGKLAAGVAHEIRNPLLPIRTAANYLLKKIPVEDENYLLINTICEESERLNKLLNNFVSFAKPSSSKDVFELNNLILETVALMKPEFESKNILLKLDLTDDRSKILASVQEIRQVLINLLLNAVDSMPCGGAISIETVTDPEFLTLSISDTGCGMSEEQKKNAFDPFFTTKKDGTGLGLFIVHNLVLKNDGKIYLRSKEGEGTTFTIKIKRHI
jgi:signal transduction histidine kinase